MLVLSRKLNERIVIGNNITITVVRTGKGLVRLGISAPEDIKILRDELVPQNEKLPKKGKRNRTL